MDTVLVSLSIVSDAGRDEDDESYVSHTLILTLFVLHQSCCAG
jgi:hypothetical protein